MDENNENNYYWWKVSDKDLHHEVFAHVYHLSDNQGYIEARNIKHARMYGNDDLVGLDFYSYRRIETSVNLTHTVKFNIISSCVDTIVSKITKNRPKPTFLTNGGDWEAQNKAKKLDKFCEGIFYSTKIYREAVKAFKDGCIFGTGVIKFYKENNEIKCERVIPEELKTDDSEAFYGSPTVLHQVKYVNKDKLKQMFPDKAGFIDAANDVESRFALNKHAKSKSLIAVIESWHLPSGINSVTGEQAEDGKHCISISNATLFCEDYTKNYFPFIFFRWQERPVGFWGMGIAEMLTGIQLEINKILKTIQLSMHLISIPKVWIEASSKIVTAHLDNKIGGIVKYAGTKPDFSSLGSIPPELFSHLDRLEQRAYNTIGVSQLSAQSKKPEGLDSGKALREFNDIETDRFQEVGVRYENVFLDAVPIILDMAKEIYEETGKFSVKVKGKEFLETINWNEVDLEEDKYIMQVFPTSALASSPSARVQDVIDLIQAGFITQDDGRRLLDFPDLKSVTDIYNASEEDINRTIDKLVHDGKYMAPEPYQNLSLGIMLMQNAYLLYKAKNCPEDRLELLRQWIQDAQAMQANMQAQAAPPTPAQPIANAQAPQASPMVSQAQEAPQMPTPNAMPQ
jgi:hypothetical protein